MKTLFIIIIKVISFHGISQELEELLPTVYDIVYGAKGVGKSELVSQVIGMEVVKIFNVKSAATDKDLIASMLQQWTGEKAAIDMDTVDVKKLLDKIIAEKKVIPTFIFDV